MSNLKELMHQKGKSKRKKVDVPMSVLHNKRSFGLVHSRAVSDYGHMVVGDLITYSPITQFMMFIST